MAERLAAWRPGLGLRTSAGWALLPALLALWALRLATAAMVDAGLHVDEAQYWDWSRDLDWGYFSKPPGIALLIRASTALAGDGLLGIRALPALCWILATALLWQLGRAMSDDGRDAQAGTWCAALFAATPAACLLGLVATTDAPLMLCWAAAMLATWHACRTGAWAWWAAAGLAWGGGLQAKYTMAALALSWAWLAWHQVAARRGVLLALAIGLLLALPNLVWNAQHGWPTLAHTADITVAAVRPAQRSLAASLGEFALGQLLLCGPALWWVGLRLWRRRGATVTPGPGSGRQAFAWAFVWPLLGLATLQAGLSRTQMNWTAPALLGLCLAAGLAARRHDRSGGGWRWPAAAGLLLGTVVALSADLPPLGGDPAARPRWDPWARMRGWDGALQALQPALAQYPALPVLAGQRELIAQAAYGWRALPRQPQALAPAGRPAHHYELVGALPRARWQAGPLLWLQSAGAAPPAADARMLAEGRRGRRALQLWLLPRGLAEDGGARR
jgi:hypothetical protein